VRPFAIIEPDTTFSASLRATLESAGFRAECFNSGTNALVALRTRAFALAILGLDLRDTDPYAVCREVSQHLPIITVAHDCAADMCVRALECGADDCVIRATSGRELVARVRNVLRRTPHHDDYDAFETSLAEMRVRAGNTTHDLTRGETEVLGVLLQHAPAPITVSRMCELLPVKRGTIESRIKSLRKKLGKGRLVSRGSLGYQLVE
jgi:two-component system copper resistance phosphate regulon response regulator CusR